MSLRSAVLLAGAALLGLHLLAAPALAGQRVALVIGNASYDHASSLANPLNDATDMGAALERLGFAVTKLPNASRAELWDGLQKFSLAASASEMAVVFYAGHGIEVDKRNFLIPVDARLLHDADVEFEAVPLDLLSRAVERAKGLRLIILDACRDNPFAVAMQRAGATRSIGRGLASVEPSGETLVAYAAKEGTVAADGEGRNSPYTTALLAHLEEPGLEVGLMFRKVRDAVLATTGGRQEPFVYGSLSSEGAYLAARPEPEEPETIVKPDPEDTKPEPVVPGNDRRLTAEELAAERVFWESVKDSQNPQELQAYLDRYPEGTYAVLARGRLKRLIGPEEKPDVHVAVTPDEPERVVSPEPAPPAPEAVEASLGLERAERRQIQMVLAALGFDPGPADGLFGQRTRAAIRDWQTSQGAAATGHLDAEATKALMAAADAAAEMAAKKSFSRDAAMETLSKAWRAAERLYDDYGRANAFVGLVEAQMAVGDDNGARRSVDEARAALNRLDDHWGHNLMLERVSRAQAATGDIHGATVTAWTITNEDNLVSALAGIAEAQAEAGKAGDAARTIAEATSIASRIGREFDRSAALLDVAKAQVEIGDIRSALATAEKIVPLNGLFGVFALTAIMRAQVEIGDSLGAENSVSKAIQAASRIAEEDDRTSAFTRIAGLQVEASDAMGAANSISKAIQAASRIAEEDDRTSAFTRIAGLQVEAGDSRGAAHSISKALELVQGIAYQDARGWSLRNIAYVQAEAGDISGALVTIQNIADQAKRHGPLAAIAEAQARAGDISGASTTTHRIQNASVRAESFARIAGAQMEAGDTQGAARSLTEALTTARQYKASFWAYVRIAEVQMAGSVP